MANEDTLKIELGKVLKKRRTSLGWGVQFVADMLGTSRNTIYKYEDGTNEISLSTLEELCFIYKIDIVEVLQSLKSLKRFKR